MTDAANAPYDCLIVGGGPAGLTAAIYLARFHRRVVVVDKDESRLAMIPVSRNHAGHPEGIAGCALLGSMREQAAQFGAEQRRGEVTELHRDGALFHAATDTGPIAARSVILATGVVNHRPPLAEPDHADAVQRGLLRYCPICDAFEQTGKRIAVLGGDAHGLAEALFLRSYSPRVTLLALDRIKLSDQERAAAAGAGIELVECAVSAFDLSGDEVALRLADGSELQFDTMYAALGSHTRNALAKGLGLRLVGDQCFATDEHQVTSLPLVYAAGDAVEGLDQISVAMGTGARAAVAAHNDLRQIDGQTLED